MLPFDDFIQHTYCTHGFVEVRFYGAGATIRLRGHNLTPVTPFVHKGDLVMIQAGVSKVIYCAGDDMGEAYGWSTEHLYKRMQGELGDQGIEVLHMLDPEKLSVFEKYKEKFGLGENEHMKVD